MSLLNEKKKRSSFYECAVNEDDSADIFQVVSDGHIAKQIPLIKMKPDCLMSVDSSNSSPLHYAAGGGRIQLIEAIINTTDSEGLNVTDNKGNTPLHLAVKNKQSESCRTLLELGADPNILNANLMSPLHMAINLRHNEIVEVLLSHSSVDMNLEGDLGNTPVMLACSIDNHEALNLLLTRGARLCEQNKLGHFAIHSAAFSGSKKSMEIILKKGEEIGYQIERHINYVDKSGSSPLHLAVHGGNIEVIQLCIANGAKIDLQQGDKSTALHFACTQGAIEAVKLMLSTYNGGQDVVNIIDGAHQTLLHKATMFDHVDLVEYLLIKGANIDSLDCESHSPLLLATTCGAWRTVELLVRKGANVKLKDSCGCNFLHLAVQQPKGLKNISEKILQDVKELLNDEDNEGCIPLHYACRLGIQESVTNMLGLKVSLHLKSKDKKSPLHFAAGYGRFNTCHQLLETMRDSKLLNEGDENGMTPLHLASQNGHIKVVELLLRKGALFLCDYKGRTCLHYAAVEGYTQTMKILLEKNIKLIDKADEDGNTALHLAAREGHVSSVSLLLSKGAEISLNKSEATFFHEAIHQGRNEVACVVIESERCHEAITTYKSGSTKIAPVLEMIEFLPESFKLLLDRSLKESEDDVNSQDYSIEYNFRYLQCPLTYTKLSKEDTVFKYQPLASLNAMVKFNRVELLTHPVSKKYLEMKWLAYGLKAHVLNLAIYSLGLVPLTILIVNLRPEISVNRMAENGTEVREVTMSTQALDKHNSFYTACMILVLVMNLYAVGKEMVQIYQQRLRYLLDYSNYLDWCVAVESLLFVIPLLYNSQEHWPWQCGAITVFHSWVNFLFYMQRFERFGIYVVMFGEILRTLFCIILLFFFLNLAFALAFYALMLEQQTFATPALSIMQTFAMMLGDISYQDNFLTPLIENRLPFPFLTFLILCLFLLLMPILLINLLIGLAVGDIAEVQRNACLKRIAMQIDLHTNLEEKLPYWFMKRVDQVKVTVYPNRACGSKFPAFWNWNGKPESRTRLNTGHCQSTPLEFEVQTQKYRLKDISKVLEKQHNLLKLIIQKMEIVSEADEQDDTELFQYGNAKRQQLLHNKSKWNSLVKAVHDKKHIIK
ncbi:transient receptor potential cation channel subfamily A member 1-like [Acipenser ruthenus]|uniref:transient receptor potential cation channel subfamily A member 1-like n=1 Tax=Acipenser ruthenus TaxID=7906 RepID=UPI0027406C5D|nr:transient receptor potential cation channel subfamily A member 1-like [Acipenser ruthenus]